MGYHDFAKLFHDKAGWLMMPMALLLLLAELKLLDLVFVIETTKPVPAHPKFYRLKRCNNWGESSLNSQSVPERRPFDKGRFVHAHERQ